MLVLCRIGGRFPLGELSLLEAKASNESCHSPALSDMERGAECLDESGGAALGKNSGRDICLATGLGRSRFIEAIFLVLISHAGLGVQCWGDRVV